MNKTYYIGLDVHKDSIAIAHALEGSREEPCYYGTCRGSVQHTDRTLHSEMSSGGLPRRSAAKAGGRPQLTF